MSSQGLWVQSSMVQSNGCGLRSAGFVAFLLPPTSNLQRPQALDPAYPVKFFGEKEHIEFNWSGFHWDDLNLSQQLTKICVIRVICGSIYPACPTCPVKCELFGIARLINRDEIFVALIPSGLNLFFLCLTGPNPTILTNSTISI